MKKLSIFLFAFLLLNVLAGTANAVVCGSSTEPELGGPITCVESVYNNSGAELDAGDVVIWDMEQSTGDNDNWVTTTTTADTFLVAGVVLRAIPIATNGEIVVRGFAAVDAANGLQAVDGPACTSTTAGSAGTCSTNAANFGFVVTAVSGGSANVCVHCNK